MVDINFMKTDSYKKLVIESVLPMCADQEKAECWYNNAVIPSLGCTANEMVIKGKINVVLNEIARIKDGGYA